MTGPPEAIAAVRLAVRRGLVDLPARAQVAAAVSGGADSLALAAALAFERPGSRALVVDHGLQPDSAATAQRAARQCADLGLDPLVLTPTGRAADGAGPEGRARRLRYGALDAAARDQGLTAVLLGHTLDDQAETVLLSLARGSGARALAGMAAVRGHYRRPLLGVRRELTRQACEQAGLTAWEDPHNSDPAYARVRVRTRVLPQLERELGPGVADSLVRTALLLRDDADALDALAREALDRSPDPTCAALMALFPGVRTRVLKAWAERACDSAVTGAHVAALRALVDDWRGQGPVALPGGVEVARQDGRLCVLAPPAGSVPRATNLGVVADAASDATRITEASRRTDSTADIPPEIERVLISEKEIAAKVAELAAQVDADYAGREILLVGVLKGAVMFMADLARALRTPVSMEFMAVSSYGSSTSSSGVVRILKDLDREIADRHVVVVEDVIDSGLTLSWLLRNMRSRGPASVEVVALLRKPEAAKVNVAVKYVGFDIASEFVVGYGLDYAERYRDLPFVGLLRPEVYAV